MPRTDMDTDPKADASTGTHDVLSDDVRARLRVDNFADELRVRMLEQELMAGMLGLVSTPVKLGRWELRAAIDQGAMGAVFRAFDPNLRREVAIKLLVCPPDGDLRERRARMETEAQAMAKLRHPNVVQVHDYVPASPSEDGKEIPSYLVMDLVEGKTLLQWQREACAGWREIVAKYEAVARGLAYIHEHQLVHRDIKPANILVRRTEEVVICDLGLVHEANREGGPRTDTAETLTSSARLTRVGAIVGTLAYMAPEQLRGETSPWSDQFSFFVALHEALYDRSPFAGDTRAKLQAAMERGLQALPPGPRRAPRWLRRLIHQGLEKAPEGRHRSMQVVADVMAAGLRPRPWGWAAATILACVLAVSVTVWARGAGEPCRGVATLAGWSDPARAAAQAGFLTSGVEGAEAAWWRFDGSAQRFAREWGRLRVATCEDRASAGPDVGAGDELTRRRDVCLDEGARLLAMFMTRYQRARASDVQYSESAAFELHEALRRCQNDALLSHGEPTYTSPEEARSLERVRADLADALVREVGGDLEGALTAANAALRGAARAGSRSLAAHASLRVGRVLSLLRRDDDAIARLKVAFSAANAIGRDDVAGDAAIELIKALALDTEELRLAASYDESVDSFIERIGGPSQRRSAAAAEAHGILALAQGRRSDAIAHHRRALELRRADPETPTGALVRSLVNLANALTEPGRDAAAVAEARALYEEAVASAVALGEAHPLVADARRARAVFLDELREHAAAQTEAEAALAAARRLYGDPSRQAAGLHVLLGMLALEGEGADAPNTARAHVEAALSYFDRNVRKGLVDSDHISALHLAADLRRSVGDLNGAAAVYGRALELLRPSRDHAGRYAETLGYLGEILLDLDQPARALPMLREAWDLLVATSAAREQSHLVILSALAEAEARAGARERALHAAREAAALAPALGLDDAPVVRARLEPILSDQRSDPRQRK